MDEQQNISLANKMIYEMRRKVEEEDRQFYVMKGRRNQSEDNILRDQPILSPEETEAIPEHQLRNQRGLKTKAFMRLSSQGYLWQDVEKQ